LAEETYSYLPGEKQESVFLTNFPVVAPEWKNSNIAEDFAKLLEVRALVSKDLEELRRKKEIGSSLDAQVKITAPDAVFKVLEAYQPSLREFFIVSQFELIKGDSLSSQGTKASGVKCERCWHYDVDTNKDSRFPGVCPKCVEALK
jgi:isoleucyl-tRNA synthetase